VARFDFGGRIRSLRDRAHLTQGELGDRLGVTATAVSHWERGRSQPQAAEVPSLANALGVSVAELYGPDVAPVSKGGDKIDSLIAEVKRAIELGPERIEINVYVMPHHGGESPTADLMQNAIDSTTERPAPGQRFTKRVLEEWPSMSEEERQEWRQLAEAIKDRGSG
jgi:transcriptional regulator with XRE-family HTH domain